MYTKGMVQHKEMELHMSNFNVGDVVRIGKGKVEYIVSNLDVALSGDLGTHYVTVESMNTGKAQVIEAGRLTLLRAAETEPMNVPQDVEMSRTQSIAEARPTQVTVPEFYNRPEDTQSLEGDDFDPRTDRRQSAYGLAILNALLRKNPRSGLHNQNALKPIGSTRDKVRNRVKRSRFLANNASAQYNEMLRVGGYRVKAA